ncbi:MAG: type II secretion system F family protein [Planctomycetes bacterium]|nr:type II secretion system F family protein [Planctomycetota bacterium]
MPRFSYKAIDHKHKSVKGTVTAESAFAARKHLRAKGVHPTSIHEITSALEARSFGGMFKRKGKAHVTEFTKQLSTMLRAGIKLTESLNVLVPQLTNADFKNAITDIRDRVITGESFADTLSEYDNYFDTIYISMVRVGEVTGTLEKSLTSIADFMDKRHKLESKMKSAMIYPVILFTASTIAVLFLTVFIIPVVAEQIEKAGQELPWVTKAILWISATLRSWWGLVVAITIFAFVWATKRFVATPRGAHVKDKFLLALPVFGALVKQRIVARFASTLSTLLESGLSMADSLKIVAEVTGNSVMNKAVKKARERILSGSDIATPLRDSGVIDPTLAHMVTVGEKSGELEKMLKDISDNLESSSDLVIERISAAIEPLIILFMSIVIGIIAYAMLVPIIRFSAGSI